jgi:hypothetical protein
MKGAIWAVLMRLSSMEAVWTKLVQADLALCGGAGTGGRGDTRRPARRLRGSQVPGPAAGTACAALSPKRQGHLFFSSAPPKDLAGRAAHRHHRDSQPGLSESDLPIHLPKPSQRQDSGPELIVPSCASCASRKTFLTLSQSPLVLLFLPSAPPDSLLVGPLSLASLLVLPRLCPCTFARDAFTIPFPGACRRRCRLRHRAHQGHLP